EVRASQRASPAGGPALALCLPARRLRGLQALAAAHAGGDLRGAAAKRLLPLRRLGRVRGGHGVCPGRRLGRGRRRPQRRKAPGAGAELRPGAAAQPARLPRRRAGLGLGAHPRPPGIGAGDGAGSGHGDGLRAQRSGQQLLRWCKDARGAFRAGAEAHAQHSAAGRLGFQVPGWRAGGHRGVPPRAGARAPQLGRP
ncbi:unnamed protein product, partial [Effrenium voratum]